MKPVDLLLIVGAPLALAILEVFHPHVHDPFELDTGVWLTVHYAQIALFPLAALALTGLVCGIGGAPAAVCRVAAFVFAVAFVAFDTAAGVVTGVLVKAARDSGNPMQWRAPVAAVWTHPIVGGAPGSTPVLALVGSTAWVAAAIAAALAVRRQGASWGPTILLVVSALGLWVFRTHAWPGGPVSFGALGAAAAWLQVQRDGRSRLQRLP